MSEAFEEALALHARGRLGEAALVYRDILEKDPNHFGSLHHLGLIKAQQGSSDEALGLIRRALEQRPDAAEARFNLGTILQMMQRYEEAIAKFESAVAIKPGYAEAHINLGTALCALNRHPGAIAHFAKALALKPDFAELHNNLGAALVASGRREEAITHYQRALAIRPDYPDAEINLGKALRALNRHEEAIRHFARALAIRPGDVEAQRSEGMARLILGDFTTGWKKWRWARQRNIPQPLWLGNFPLSGRTILLHAEQGLGDTIQFARYIPLVAQQGAAIVLEVHEQLAPLLAGLQGVSAVRVLGEALPAFDCYCPLLSLALAFGTTPETVPGDVPYLFPPADKIARWRSTIARDAGPRIGLTWSGNPAHLNDPHRSIPLPLLLPLLSDPAFHFVAVQKELRDADALALMRYDRVSLAGERLIDFSDTAALIATLDLVITVDTSVAHLAGALGRPVWILLPLSPDWRWLLDRADSPWYPSARLFRQPASGDWGSVVAQVQAALQQHFPAP